MAARPRSDWMELEQTRGISITSAAMQFEYHGPHVQPARHTGPHGLQRGHLPRARRRRRRRDGARRGEGHRTPDAQAVRGVPQPQPAGASRSSTSSTARAAIRSSCSTRSRRRSDLRPTPATWPVGDGDDFLGVIDRRRNMFSRFTRTARGATMAPEELMTFDQAAAIGGNAWKRAMDGCDLLEAVGADVDLESFLAGSSTPVLRRFGPHRLRREAPARRRGRTGARPRRRGPIATASAARSTPAPAPSCSRCRPTWTSRTATGSPSPASAAATSSAA